MMKVKCITDRMSKLTKGKEYKVLDKVLSRYNVYLYLLNTDLDYLEWIHQSHLLEVTDTPQIEVGSEWVSGEGRVYTIKYASNKTVVYGEDDLYADTDEFIKLLKPKPKTVTMYFYKTPRGYVAYSDKHPFDTVAFTKEIEL